MKKVLSVLMVMVMIVCMSSTVFASNKVDTSFMDKINPNQSLSGGAGEKMQTIGSTILTLVTNTAMILAVIIIAILGVKYMMGSLEEKAEYKKTMMPYLIGAILVFGAGAIGKMVVGIGASLIV